MLTLAACSNNKGNKGSFAAWRDNNGSFESTSHAETNNEMSNTSEGASGEEIYHNKIYNVGEDIPENKYVINCTNTEYSLDVIVFADEKDYENFQKAEQFTVGEYRKAVETHAYANFFLEQGEKAFVSLKKGYILLLDDGMCEFSKFDPNDSTTIYSGLYVIGEDIEGNKLNIKCTTDSLKVVVFDNKEKYLQYYKTDRFTVGEEADAIKQYSASTDFIYSDKSTFVNLKDGMIMLVEDGIGEYSLDKGPIIN